MLLPVQRCTLPLCVVDLLTEGVLGVIGLGEFSLQRLHLAGERGALNLRKRENGNQNVMAADRQHVITYTFYTQPQES